MLTCRFFRSWRTLREAHDPVRPSWVSRHLETCPACRADDAAHARLCEALRAEAAGGRAAAPPFLAGRIVHTLAARPPATSPRFGWLAVGLTGTTALAAVVLALALRFWPSPNPPATPSLTNSGPKPLAPTLLAETALPAAERLLELSGTLDLPLQNELDAVMSDARSAVQFLASNFLPDRTR